MADPIADLHMVLTTCGVSVEATRALIINNKSITLIADLWFLDGDDNDVNAMSLRMARRVANNGRISLGRIHIKKIQAFVWWFRDHQKIGQQIDAALWTVASMMNAGIVKLIKKY